jgi:hypothetical protein
VGGRESVGIFLVCELEQAGEEFGKVLSERDSPFVLVKLLLLLLLLATTDMTHSHFRISGFALTCFNIPSSSWFAGWFVLVVNSDIGGMGWNG